MIMQKEEYEKWKKKQGDSDLMLMKKMTRKAIVSKLFFIS